MRQFLKFLPVYMFMCLFVLSTEAQAISTKAKQDEQIKQADENKDEIIEKINASARKASEQLSVAEAASRKQQGDYEDANNINASKRSQEEATVDINGEYNNREDAMCSFPSVSQSTASGKESAEQLFQMELPERNKVIAGEPGTQSENGLVAFQNALYDKMQSLDSDRFSMGNLIGQYTIPTGGVADQKLAYMQDLLYARVPVYLNKDLKDNPDTEVKNASIAADRLRAEMSIGQSIFSRIKANRASNKGNGRAIQFQKEIMEKNGFSGEYLKKLLVPDASYRAQLEAMTVGQFGSEYMQEKLLTNHENYGGMIVWNLMLNNLIQMEQYALLESIALATSTQVIATREEAIKDVNSRFSAKGAGQ